MSATDLAEPVVRSGNGKPRDNEYGHFFKIGFTGDLRIAGAFLESWNSAGVQEDCRCLIDIHPLLHTVERAAVFFGVAGEQNSSRCNSVHAVMRSLSVIHKKLQSAGEGGLDAIIHFGGEDAERARSTADTVSPGMPFFVAHSPTDAELQLVGRFPQLKDDEIDFDPLDVYLINDFFKDHLPDWAAKPPFSIAGGELSDRDLPELQGIMPRRACALSAEFD